MCPERFQKGGKILKTEEVRQQLMPSVMALKKKKKVFPGSISSKEKERKGLHSCTYSCTYVPQSICGGPEI
eukprot:733113-Pelagomonas_calceolata.AAC.1